MRRVSLAMVGTVLLLAGLVTGAEAQSKRVRGTIGQVAADTITIHAIDGSDQTLKLAPDVRIASDKALALTDIKAGDFIGTAANKGADGRLVAIEVTVFPAALRGTREGQRPWDQGPNSSMTNANVDQIVTGTSGRTLKLSYKGGLAEVDVPPETPIVTPVPGDRSLLIPGMAAVAFVRPAADGSPAVAYLTVEKDGVKPP